MVSKFQKMSCKLALQIFSHTMASAMKTCQKMEAFQSKTIMDTIDFISSMNKLFDTLNSKTPYHNNPNKFGISRKNPQIMDNLQHGMNIFLGLTSKGARQQKPPCLDGMVQTLRGIIL